MRHKYDTPALVLARTSQGEANVLLTLLTPALGLVRARAQGLRRSGAKLSHALTTLSEASVILVRGQEGWRLSGAMLEEAWSTRLNNRVAREVVGRVSGLLMRLVGGEEHDPKLFTIMQGLLHALDTLPEAQYDALETLAALRIIAALGLDAGEIPGTSELFTPPVLEAVQGARTDYILRINRGITASGL